MSESKYNISFRRDFLLLGPANATAHVQKTISRLNFLVPKVVDDLSGYKSGGAFFALAVVDFKNLPALQAIAKIFNQALGPRSHRILYAADDSAVDAAALLFAQEIGVRYVAHGVMRDRDLVDYLKRICLAEHRQGSILEYEDDFASAAATGDEMAMHRLLERLKSLPEQTEDSLRLQAAGYFRVGQSKRAEAALKQILRLNRQNLWAANTLGKIYLQQGRTDDAIAVLQRLSQFHELNAERYLTLGQAYVAAGDHQAAKSAFKQGDQLAGGEDERFKSGLAQAHLAAGEVQDALDAIDGQYSEDVLSFLNMQAVLAARRGDFQAANASYKQAIEGSQERPLILAKLYFNQGLAQARSGDLSSAMDSFTESIAQGGSKFSRASRPLAIVAKLKEQAQAPTTATIAAKLDAEADEMDDFEWQHF